MAHAEKEKSFQEVADEYGKRVVAGMAEKLAALEHAASECEPVCDRCDGTGDDDEKEDACPKCEGTGETECKAGADSDDPEAWHDEERARRRIEESPLSLEVRSGWQTLDSYGTEPPYSTEPPEEYCILLGTGGPASRIRGELDEYGQPTSAVFEYQDWFKPWTPARLTSAEESTLLEWALAFNFEVSR